MKSFDLNLKLIEDSIELRDLPLSKVIFKNETAYPWFILVPRQPELAELIDLDFDDQIQLLTEINQISKILQDQFKPDKINIATLGNQVSQLHVHVIGRFKTDPFWPQPIWQLNYKNQPYTEHVLNKLIKNLNLAFDKL